jgi:Icc-related predicted phosphoesterase
MKLLILSDLHFEFCNPNFDQYIYNTSQVDVVVIAGDMGDARITCEILEKFSELSMAPVIYVTGNHDYYHSSRFEIDEKLVKLESQIDSFLFLNHAVVDINDVRFIGVTGWNYFPDLTFENYEMSDFLLIKDYKYLKQWYDQDRQFLEDELSIANKNKDIRKTVVVTHVPPCLDALDLHNEASANYLIANKLVKVYHNQYLDIIQKYQPNVWISGHMHDTVDKIIDRTRCIRNAYGYHGSDRLNENFKHDFIIEV